MKRIITFSILFVIVVFSCRTSKMLLQNLSYLYDKSMFSYIPEYLVFHKNDTVTSVYFSLNSGNLLYTKEINHDNFTSMFSIKAELFDSYDMKQLLESNSVEMIDSVNSHKHEITGSLDIKTRTHGLFLLKLIFSDLNKHTNVDYYMNFHNKNRNESPNFIMLNADSTPVFSKWISGEEEFRIVSNNKNLNKLWVRYYDRIFPIATPPFLESNIKPFDFTEDSLFSVPFTDGSTSLIKLPRKGFYHFQVDTATKEGFTVFRFDDDYPNVTSVEQMLEPLHFLTSKYEFNDIILMKDKNEAVQNFWLETAGNADRAKKLVKMYYNHVQEANTFFTSYFEGWKTDRGIIYIIYGPPNIVFKGKNFETWTYGEEKNMLSINFSFYKIENPFSDNDYSIAKSPLYKDGWYMAVDSWRR